MTRVLRIVAALLLVPLAALAGGTLQVGVKEAQLRVTPSPFGQIARLLHYGDTVEVLDESGAWLRVRAAGNEGWLHRTLLAERVRPLQAGAGDLSAGASRDEITLAGKGFNAQVEEEYRKENRSLDFARIDRMEKRGVTPEQMARFVRDGGLVPAGGRP